MVPSARVAHAGGAIAPARGIHPFRICPKNENPATRGGVFDKYGNEEGDLEAQRKN